MLGRLRTLVWGAVAGIGLFLCFGVPHGHSAVIAETNLSERFPTGPTLLETRGSWGYLASGGGLRGRVSTRDADLDPEWGVSTPSVFHTRPALSVAEVSDSWGTTDLKVDRTGRVLFAGWIGSGSIFPRPYLARYREDGYPDTGFGRKGIKLNTQLLVGSSSRSYSGALGIDRKGRIYTSIERYRVTSPRRSPVRRHTVERRFPDGTLDRSYGRGGRVTIGGNGHSWKVMDLVVNARGRTFLLVRTPRRNVRVMSLRSDGSLDRRFLKNSRWASLPGPRANEIRLDLDSAGHLTAAISRYRRAPGLLLVRLKQDGRPVRSFASGGRLWITNRWLARSVSGAARLPGLTRGIAGGFDVGPDQKTTLTLAGPQENDWVKWKAVTIRLDRLGNVDRTFDSNGHLTRFSVQVPVRRVLPVSVLDNGSALVVTGVDHRNLRDADPQSAMLLVR